MFLDFKNFFSPSKHTVVIFWINLFLHLSTPTLAQQLSSEIILDCLIQPSDVIRVASAEEGLISEINVKRGDSVSRGSVIASLEYATQEVDLAMAHERTQNDFNVRRAAEEYRYRQRILERKEALGRASAISEAALDDARIAVSLAKLNLGLEEVQNRLNSLAFERAKAELEQRHIRSPIDGLVIDVPMSVGEYRDGSAHVAVLANIDSLNVEVFAPVEYFSTIRVGQSAKVFTSDPYKKEWTATVTVVDQVFDAASNTFGIRLTMPNIDRTLPGGARCKIEFIPESRIE